MSRPLILASLFVLFAVLRLSAPSDLLEGDQKRQVAYIMDVLHHDDWLIQYETNGLIAAKPPLYNWCAAGLCKLFGTRAEWVLKLPSLLAGIGLLTCLYCLGCKFFDDRSAFYACVACIASHHFSKLAWFARTDMLMTFTVHLAITILVCCRSAWWKSPLIGAVLGLSALTKGPVGPVLFGLFLLLWSWHEGTLRSPLMWRRMLPGGLLFAVIAGGWLALVWDVPQFQDRVLHWQLGSHMTEERLARPFYYHFGYLFTRIAPWTLVAIATALAARRWPEWPRVRFVLCWALLFLALFSIIPIKRHDHLLPVYPAVFLLAGLGVRRLLEPVVTPQAGCLVYPIGLFLTLMPLLLTKVQEPAVCILLVGTCVCGLTAVWCFRRGQRAALPILAAGLVLVHGVYHHWLHQAGRADYAGLTRFVEQVKQQVGASSPVILFQTHPLIAYELGQHERIENPQQLAEYEGQWLIVPDYYVEMLEQQIHWKLKPALSLSIPPRKEQATLYRIESRPPAGAASGNVSQSAVPPRG